jgi:exosortase
VADTLQVPEVARASAVAIPSAADASVVADRSDRSVWRAGVLPLLVAELVLLYAPTVAFLWDRWTMSVWHNAHGALVPPIVAFLIYFELKRFKGGPAEGSAWGFLLLVPALVLHAVDAGIHTQLLAAISIVIALPGLSLLLIGAERTRAIAFPLLFLLAALPIPLGMTEQIHMQLRLIATAATASIVPYMGIPVFAEGTTLQLSTGRLQITDACSGFSTLYAAAAVALLTAYSTPGWRRRALVLGLAAPLAIAANILRVVSLTALTVWTGPQVLDTFIHPLSGMLTFALALPIIFWLGGDSHSSRRAVERA